MSVASDGEQKMTGCIQGVATCFEHACRPGLFCIWCGLHQLDLKLQLFYKEWLIVEDDGAPGNERVFYSILTGLIAYLRQQQSLIAEMKTTCRTLSNTCWESMSNVSSWFKKH